MNIVSIPDSKWSCSSCGDCCRGFSFGPVEDHVVRSLKALNVEKKWKPAENGWAEKNQNGDWFFRETSGHCVFLRKDNLCAIHALYGEESKPWFCREYPFHFIRETRGIAVRIREDCGGFHKTFSTGNSVLDQSESLSSLLRPVPIQSVLGKTIVIAPGLGVGEDNWSQVEPHLLDLFNTSVDIRQAVASIRRAICNMSGRETPEVGSFEVLHRNLIEELQIQIQNAVDLPPRFGPMRQFLLDTLSTSSKSNRSFAYTPEAQSYWKIVCKGRFIGKRFVALGSLPAGMGLSLFEWRLFAGLEQLTSLNRLGPALATWKRALNSPPFWHIVQSSKLKFSELYFSA